MPFDVHWDVHKYRDDHESEEHWELRKAFMEKWKTDYPEERLVCLARAFTNIEFMGCRYPKEVMEEVAKLSFEVVQPYRKIKKTRLQRTFVSASDAAEDRAKGIKREGGIIKDEQPKSKRIAFVAQGEKPDSEPELKNYIQPDEPEKSEELSERKVNDCIYLNEFLTQMREVKCLSVREFRDYMFTSSFGRLVLVVRPWSRKLGNIQTSCQTCGATLALVYKNRYFTLTINGYTVATATGDTKAEARNAVETLAWEKLRTSTVSVLMKEQFIAQGSTISVSDVSGTKQPDIFGTPIENSVAVKMMQMMGWKGGGLGADAQGIAEPIKPNMQMVNRAGLGSQSDVRHFRRAALSLMQRFIAADAFDLDLIFSSDFSKDERAVLHQCAKRAGLASRSYGGDKDRFLVVKKKLDPFSLARAVIEQGGETPKYQVFIPAILAKR